MTSEIDRLQQRRSALVDMLRPLQEENRELFGQYGEGEIPADFAHFFQELDEIKAKIALLRDELREIDTAVMVLHAKRLSRPAFQAALERADLNAVAAMSSFGAQLDNIQHERDFRGLFAVSQRILGYVAEQLVISEVRFLTGTEREEWNATLRSRALAEVIGMDALDMSFAEGDPRGRITTEQKQQISQLELRRDVWDALAGFVIESMRGPTTR